MLFRTCDLLSPRAFHYILKWFICQLEQASIRLPKHNAILYWIRWDSIAALSGESLSLMKWVVTILLKVYVSSIWIVYRRIIFRIFWAFSINIRLRRRIKWHQLPEEPLHWVICFQHFWATPHQPMPIKLQGYHIVPHSLPIWHACRLIASPLPKCLSSFILVSMMNFDRYWWQVYWLFIYSYLAYITMTPFHPCPSPLLWVYRMIRRVSR